MGQVSPLPSTPNGAQSDVTSDVVRPAVRPTATVRMISPLRCGLCGAVFEEGAQRYLVVSPQSAERRLMVCHTCRNAALTEGYRPAG